MARNTPARGTSVNGKLPEIVFGWGQRAGTRNTRSTQTALTSGFAADAMKMSRPIRRAWPAVRRCPANPPRRVGFRPSSQEASWGCGVASAVVARKPKDRWLVSFQTASTRRPCFIQRIHPSPFLARFHPGRLKPPATATGRGAGDRAFCSLHHRRRNVLAWDSTSTCGPV